MGVIPGRHKPKDPDSYAYPVIMELLEFLSGIPTFDVEQDEMFQLHAYLIAVFGDIPAIAMIMLSSHDILRYFNTRFYHVTYSDLLRRTPKYSGDLLLILFK